MGLVQIGRLGPVNYDTAFWTFGWGWGDLAIVLCGLTDTGLEFKYEFYSLGKFLKQPVMTNMCV